MAYCTYNSIEDGSHRFLESKTLSDDPHHLFSTGETCWRWFRRRGSTNKFPETLQERGGYLRVQALLATFVVRVRVVGLVGFTPGVRVISHYVDEFVVRRLCRRGHAREGFSSAVRANSVNSLVLKPIPSEGRQVPNIFRSPPTATVLAS